MELKEIIQYEPFRTLWKRDRKPNRVWGTRDCEYVYYMYSASADNPYRITPEHERFEMLQRDIYGDDYRTDDTLEWALEKWKQMNLSVEEKLLNVSMRVALRLIDHLEALDWESRSVDTEKILKDLDSISKAKGILDQLKKIKEAADSNAFMKRGRGKKEINEWEDPKIAEEYVSKSEDQGSEE